MTLLIMIKTKHNQQVWIQKLFVYCVYLFPESTLMRNVNLQLEIIKTISLLQEELPEE